MYVCILIINICAIYRSNPFDNNQYKKDDVSIDTIKNKLHLSLNADNQDDQFNKDKSPSSVKDVKDIILASSKSILGKVLSPTKEKYSSREKVCVFIYIYVCIYTYIC